MIIKKVFGDSVGEGLGLQLMIIRISKATSGEEGLKRFCPRDKMGSWRI